MSRRILDIALVKENDALDNKYLPFKFDGVLFIYRIEKEGSEIVQFVPKTRFGNDNLITHGISRRYILLNVKQNPYVRLNKLFRIETFCHVDTFKLIVRLVEDIFIKGNWAENSAWQKNYHKGIAKGR